MADSFFQRVANARNGTSADLIIHLISLIQLLIHLHKLHQIMPFLKSSQATIIVTFEGDLNV